MTERRAGQDLATGWRPLRTARCALAKSTGCREARCRLSRCEMERAERGIPGSVGEDGRRKRASCPRSSVHAGSPWPPPAASVATPTPRPVSHHHHHRRPQRGSVSPEVRASPGACDSSQWVPPPAPTPTPGQQHSQLGARAADCGAAEQTASKGDLGPRLFHSEQDGESCSFLRGTNTPWKEHRRRHKENSEEFPPWHRGLSILVAVALVTAVVQV